MKLTTRQRHKLYKIVLKNVQQDGWDYVGFCAVFLQYANIDVYKKGNLKEYFPEIYKYKPKLKEKDCHWFPLYCGKDKIREKILRSAIKETTPKKKVYENRIGQSRRKTTLKRSRVRKNNGGKATKHGTRRVAKKKAS